MFDIPKVYCEQLLQIGWEPINTISNLAFVIAGIIAFYKLPNKRSLLSVILTVALMLIGFGSGWWHAFHTHFGDILDTLFIAIFAILIGILFLKKLTHSWLISSVSFLVLLGITLLVEQLTFLNGSLPYIFLLIALVLGGHLYSNTIKESKSLLLKAYFTFGLAIIFRTLDMLTCPFVPFGTHFMWHILVAILGYQLILIISSLPIQKNQLPDSTNKRILFIHHSTGGNLIKEGNLREAIKKINPEIEFWDHNYNLFPIFTYILANNTHLKGLSDSDGAITGIDYKITVSNNSPREYADIFSRDPNDPTLKEILKYDVIAFKNCYPTTRIKSDAQLQEDIHYYEIIRDSLGKYQDKKFVLLTPPPARKETNNLENAARTKKLVAWLNSNEFLKDSTNIYVFDFFTLLADENGFLKPTYTRSMFFDSHPNLKANKTVSPAFAKFLADVMNK